MIAQLQDLQRLSSGLHPLRWTSRLVYPALCAIVTARFCECSYLIQFLIRMEFGDVFDTALKTVTFVTNKSSPNKLYLPALFSVSIFQPSPVVFVHSSLCGNYRYFSSKFYKVRAGSSDVLIFNFVAFQT
jgi:hypothetical protein